MSWLHASLTSATAWASYEHVDALARALPDHPDDDRTLDAKRADVFIDLLLGTPAELETAVADGTRDVVVGPMSQKVPGLTYLPIYREPHALYCGRPHPLFDIPDDRLERSAIEEASFAVRGYQHFDDLYRANHPLPAGTVMHMEAQVMMILSGHFIGFLPCHIGEDWVGRGLMRPLKPKTYNFASTHFVVTRSADEQRALVQSFVQEIKRQAAASSP